MKQKASKKMAWVLAAALCASVMLPAATLFALQGGNGEKIPFNGVYDTVFTAFAETSETKQPAAEPSASYMMQTKGKFSLGNDYLLLATNIEDVEAGYTQVGYKVSVNGNEETEYASDTYYTGITFKTDDAGGTETQTMEEIFEGNVVTGMIVQEIEYSPENSYTITPYFVGEAGEQEGTSVSVEPVPTVTQIFEAEAMTLTGKDEEENQNLGFVPGYDATGYSGTGFLLNVSGYTFEMSVDAPRALTVDLSVKCARTNLNTDKEFISALTVNGSEEFVAEKQSITSVTDSSGWYDWKEYRIAELNLVEGENVISMTFGYNSNVDYFTFTSEDEIVLTSEKENGHSYTEWTVTKMPTETEEGRLYRYCSHCCRTEEAVLPRMAEGVYESVYTPASGKQVGYTTYTVEDKTFVVMDKLSENATGTALHAIDSDYTSGQVANPLKPDSQTIGDITLMSTGSKCGEMVFDFTLSEDAAVEFILDICRYKSSDTANVQYLDWFTYILDGKEIAVSDLLTIAPSAAVWNELASTSLFIKNLAAGEHTLIVRANGGKTGCLLGVSLKSEAGTAWTPAE